MCEAAGEGADPEPGGREAEAAAPPARCPAHPQLRKRRLSRVKEPVQIPKAPERPGRCPGRTRPLPSPDLPPAVGDGHAGPWTSPAPAKYTQGSPRLSGRGQDLPPTGALRLLPTGDPVKKFQRSVLREWVKKISYRAEWKAKKWRKWGDVGQKIQTSSYEMN